MKKHPEDKDAREKYSECKKKERLRLFAKAISQEERKSPLETYDPSQTAIDSSYNGPHLAQDEDGNYFVTLDFMKSLIETYKSQGKLHRKYAMIVCFYNLFTVSPSDRMQIL